jgi:hypothetical protein
LRAKLFLFHIFSDAFPQKKPLDAGGEGLLNGTPTKRRVSKRQVSKTSGFETSETSGLQNVRFTKRQVYKMSGLQNVRSSKRPVAKKTSVYILYLWLVEIRRFCCSNVCRQSDGCVLFSIL